MVITLRLRKLLALTLMDGVIIKGLWFVHLRFLPNMLVIKIIRDIRFIIRGKYLRSYRFGITMLVLYGHLDWPSSNTS